MAFNWTEKVKLYLKYKYIDYESWLNGSVAAFGSKYPSSNPGELAQIKENKYLYKLSLTK